MNNKNIRNNILHKISQRIVPTNNQLQYQNNTCKTCIRSSNNDHQAIPQRKSIKKPVKQNSKQKATLSLHKKIYNLKIQKRTEEQLLKDALENQSEFASYHRRKRIQSQSISVDTHELFISQQKYIQQINKTIHLWLDNMMRYMQTQDYLLQDVQLPHQNKQNLYEFRLQCYDRIDVINDMFKKQYKKNSLDKKASSISKKTIDSSSALQSSKKIINRSDNENQLRMIYTQALAIQKLMK